MLELVVVVVALLLCIRTGVVAAAVLSLAVL